MAQRACALIRVYSCLQTSHTKIRNMLSFRLPSFDTTKDPDPSYSEQMPPSLRQTNTLRPTTPRRLRRLKPPKPIPVGFSSELAPGQMSSLLQCRGRQGARVGTAARHEDLLAGGPLAFLRGPFLGRAKRTRTGVRTGLRHPGRGA